MFHHFTERKTCKCRIYSNLSQFFYRNQSLNYLTVGHYLELFPRSLICLGFSLAVSLLGYKKHFGIINVYDKVSANTASLFPKCYKKSDEQDARSTY